VARIPSEVKRAFLRTLYRSFAKGDKPSLEDAILDFTEDRVTAIKGGQITASVSGNGYSASYMVPVPGSLSGFSMVEVTALGEELATVYDEAKADLTATGGDATDAGIYAEMLDRLKAVTSLTNDFTTYYSRNTTLTQEQ
jgi:hypothetical protein